MKTTCAACGLRPAVSFAGKEWLCGPCAQKNSATKALPFIGAALVAAGLVAGGALLLDKMKENEQGGPGGSSPIVPCTICA